MKVNKKSAIKQFQESIEIFLARHYSDAISDNVKRCLKRKREKLQCKAK